MELAGGFRKGDRASLNGKSVVVVGPPAVAAAARFSLTVQFEDGHCSSVRAETLSPAASQAGGAIEQQARPMAPASPEKQHVNFAFTPERRPVRPAAFDLAPPEQKPLRPSANNTDNKIWSEVKPAEFLETPDKRLIPPTSGKDVSFWHSQTHTRKRMTEDIPAPQGYVTGGYPSANFIKAVIEKDPRKNDIDAPDTQTICAMKGKYHKALPDDPIARQKELVRIYTMETQIYPQMNLALRQDNLQRLTYFGAFIKELRDVFYTDHVDQIIEPYVGTVYRGITVPNPAQFMQEYVPKYEFVWTSFTSTTSEKDMASGFGNLLFEIHCREPATGSFDDDFPEYAPADIRMFSDSKEETEILIPPNTRLRVITSQMPTRTNGLTVPLICCETVGYDSIWGLIDDANYGEISQFCKKHYHLVQSDGYTHSIFHAGLDSGDPGVAEAMMHAEPNFDQECPSTGLSGHQKLSVRFPSLSKRYQSTQAAAAPAAPAAPTADSFDHGYDPDRLHFKLPESPIRPVADYDANRLHFTIPESPMKPASVAPSMSSAGTRTSLKGDDFTRQELAGGFAKGDTVIADDGAYGVVVGPPGKKALHAISVTVRYDSGELKDTRANKLRLV